MLSAVIATDHRYPALQLAPQPGHERVVRLGPLVLKSAPLNSPTPTTDTDRTVSRRSEPSSCATLTGEQPDPWDLLQPQDVTSRHRGAKPRRRYELSGAISLLSPAYLLSVAR
uniref:Cell wall-associated hydrolase n=1 Tax=Phlebotomus kandelakii TaxID=1109342 RepID=A0A6B2EKL5_9DIPT